MRYNVRCCCQPVLVLGTLDLPPNLRDGQTLVVQEHRGPIALVGPAAPVKTDAVRTHVVEMRKYQSIEPSGWHRVDELAVYSEDRPIEFWRKIAGFKEAGR